MMAENDAEMMKLVMFAMYLQTLPKHAQIQRLKAELFSKSAAQAGLEKFTINGVPIRKIFLRNVLPKLNQERLRNMFSKYGPIESVEILEQPRLRKKKCAIITFRNFKDAEKVLKQLYVDVSRYRMFVFPAYGICGTSTENAAASRFGENLEFLKEVDSQKGTPIPFLSEFKDFPFINGILQNLGAHLKKLNLQKMKIFGADALIDAIADTCPELEDLRLEALYINDKKIDRLKAITNKLKVLSLVDCNPIKDFHLETLLEKNSVLVHLEVTRSCYVQGSFLKSVHSKLETLNLSYNGQLFPSKLILRRHAKTLQNLSIANCKHIENADINKILRKLPNLRSLSLGGYRLMFGEFLLLNVNPLEFLESLDLSNNQQVDDIFLQAIIQKCPQLKELNLSGAGCPHAECSAGGHFNVANLKNMPNLRSLNLSFLDHIKDQLIKGYVPACPPIESLYLAGCSKLTDEDIKCVLTSCRQLKYLDFSSCHRLTRQTIRAANEVVKNRTNQLPLNLAVGDTKMIVVPEPEEQIHSLLTLEYKTTQREDHSIFRKRIREYGDDDWTHLMYGVGKSSYYHLSDEDDSDFDGMNSHDFDTDDDSEDERYDIDPRIRTYVPHTEEHVPSCCIS